MLQFMFAFPQLHRLAGAPLARLCECGRVVVGEEFAAMLDVTAEAVDEVQPVTSHLRDPDGESHISSIRGRYDCMG